MMKHLPPHLGGHKNTTHIDKGALNFLIKKFNVRSIIDVGCGPGGMLKVAQKLGIDCVGIDGDLSIINSKIIVHDFCNGSISENKHKLLSGADLAWSVEFAEHVEEKYMLNYLNVFKKCNHIIMTAAPPGKSGWHHVNCQNSLYWIDKMQSIGFIFDKSTTSSIRKASTMKRNFMRKYGLFFNKKTASN